MINIKKLKSVSKNPNILQWISEIESWSKKPDFEGHEEGVEKLAKYLLTSGESLV